MNIVEAHAESASFRMIVTNEWERWRIESLPTKEPETVRWILEHFRPGDTLFDIGANIGIFAILAASANREGTVVAIEPMAASFQRLCENAQVNELRNLRPYCLAAGARDGLGTLSLTSLDAASSMHSLGDTGIFGEPVVLQTGIGVVTLDTLAATAGMPSLLKLDVDGGEDDVLAGAENVLRHVRTAIVEFNWIDGNPTRRDEPLRRAGLAPAGEGILYEHGAVRWQNVIYTR
jgi:FkbM family methyltransferase